MINKKNIMALSLIGIMAMTGCAGTAPKKEEVVKEEVAVSPEKAKYNLVVKKTIDDCKEQGVELDEKRTDAFINKFPQSEIDKIVTITHKLPKKNCLFFADEISEEKEQKVEEIVRKTIKQCKEYTINLDETLLTEKAKGIPLFILRRILAKEKLSTEAECQHMAERYSKQ